MALLTRDVAGFVDPSKVADWVRSCTVGGYLAAVVTAVLVFDAGKQSSLTPTPLPTTDITFNSMHIRPGGEQQGPIVVGGVNMGMVKFIFRTLITLG